MKSMQDIELIREVCLWDKVVLVDGVGRSGKSMLGPIIASFENVEIERIEPIFERIPVLDALGKISKDAAIQMLQMEVDFRLYESMIGRNTNFRFKDHSSVFNNPFKFEYFKRVFGKDGQVVVNKILEKKPIFQVMVHDTLGKLDVYFDAFKDKVFVLEMVRDPIDMIYSWYQRGWGWRITTDPRVAIFTYQSRKGIAPLSNLDSDCEYHDLEPMDRVIHIIEENFKNGFDKYQELSDERKKQILFIIFEEFVTETDKNIERVEKFLGVKKTKHTPKQLKKERIPRVLTEKGRKEKEEFIKAKASAVAYKKIEGLYEYYETIKKIATS